MNIRKKFAGGVSLAVGAVAVAVAVCVGTASALAAPNASSMTRADAVSSRPSSVPSDYVVTPNGYFHPSCVQQVGDGESIQADGSLRRGDGSIRRIAACTHPHFSQRGDRIEANATSLSLSGEEGAGKGGSIWPVINGWTAYSETNPSNTGGPYAGKMTSDMTVPSAPSRKTGQTLFYFPGLEASPNAISILQPVLQWNEYNDNAWTVASWNCCISGTTYSSNPISTATGHIIYGSMVGACGSSSVCPTWNIVSQDTTTGQSTTLSNTGADGQAFNWLFGGVLEMYGVRSCLQLPTNGSESFTNLAIYDTTLKPITPTWQVAYTKATPQCSYKVTTTTTTATITFKP